MSSDGDGGRGGEDVSGGEQQRRVDIDIDTLETDIDTLETDIETLDIDIDILEIDIDTLEIEDIKSLPDSSHGQGTMCGLLLVEPLVICVGGSLQDSRCVGSCCRPW
ncbi:hypothetical protein Pmani_027428 [Petrolisthes manimaculis]|uniref:Uncharacterized protein n=1 Tax=Petrolisthes manimaculis TaxID=1843537 RepID=A0AAE1TWU5_9EUCA|nr:hypothetical protein Pmani_027428 [Petrolisthes manimaculis]